MLKKPVVVEEFGKRLVVNEENGDSILGIRDQIFQETYSAIETSVIDGRAIGGSMFWRWDLPMFAGASRGILAKGSKLLTHG